MTSAAQHTNNRAPTSWGKLVYGLIVGITAGICAPPVHAESDWTKQAFDKPTVLASAQVSPGGRPNRNPRGKVAANDKSRPHLRPAHGLWRWKVTKASWSAEDEAGYETFVSKIGESDCRSVHECLTSPLANPRFHDRNPPKYHFFADCADLPFVLRAYYAWQTGLPFSFPYRIAMHPRIAGHKSNLLGFQVAARWDVVGPGPDIRLALPAISSGVSSANFRAPPGYAGKILDDHYPVRVTRESVRPGTIVFDPDGHIAVVSHVTEDGRVHYIDAHPDNSLSRGIYGRDFARADPPMGAGFKRWRPQTLVGARAAPDGTLWGGRIVLTSDQHLPDWSDEQFFGSEKPKPEHWSQGRFAVDGLSVDYHDYVRLRLAHPGFRYDPVDETRVMMRQLCRELGYRVDAVAHAVKAGFDRKPQPDRLPKNIYATSGDWEIYSTPSRDARIKTTFEELRDETARFIELAGKGSGLLKYTGKNLRADLLAVYEAEAAACSVTYTRSNGKQQKLGFEDVRRRLFRMSFDPYHCVERRWGAEDAEELSSCTQDATKNAWYEAQRRLRNQVVRTYGEPMGWGLAELQNETLDIGIREVPDIDILKVLQGTETAQASE
jgi:hypothetical protein